MGIRLPIRAMNPGESGCWAAIVVHRLRGTLLCAIAFSVVAGSLTQARAQSEDSRNRFSLNSRIGFNIKADFKNLGGFPAQSNPGPATGRMDHFYDDGFNRVDINGNANSNTWYWGYQHTSQVFGTNSIVMNSSFSPATGAIRDVSEDPQFGAELAYFRVLGDDRAYRWGVEAAVGWLDLTFSEDRTTSSDVFLTSDAYALNGMAAPPAPYAGTFDRPGPVIGDVPNRTFSTLPNAAMTTGRYNLDARAYNVRLGLRYESPFNDRVALRFGGGFSGAFVDSEFGFQETTTVSGVGSTTRFGSGSETDFILGAYAGAGLTVHFTRRLSGFVGAQYEHLGDFNQQAGGKEARIDFSSSIFVIIGLGFNL